MLICFISQKEAPSIEFLLMQWSFFPNSDSDSNRDLRSEAEGRFLNRGQINLEVKLYFQANVNFRI